jgi:hypothetical protein
MFMKGRIDAFEKLFMSGSMGLNSTPHYTQPFPYSPEYDAPGPSPTGEPQGMIPIPEDIRRLHSQSIQQQSFLASQENSQPNRRQNSTSGWQTGGGYFGRLMVGSLAGLMIMEGFSEAEQEGDTPGARGLFALPTQLLRSASQMLHSFFNFNVVGYRTLDYMKIWLILGALLYAFIPSLFARTPKSKAGETQKTLAAAPSLASSIQVRRQAWLTAIQTVWVPRHNFFLEAAALLLKIVKLSMLNLIGSHGYAYLTGVTQQQEEARVKAWEIALDAQLAGGDVEVSKSRLTLTLLASGTLPDTPARLMLKAVHIRVLLWEIGNAGFNGFSMFQVFATRLARWKWNEAKQLQRSLARTRGQHGDELPEHLAALLDQECDEVLVDTIGQRAYNLAWNLPTTHNSEGSSDAMDGVVEDFAIRSPLDAVAAWYSSLVLQRALSKSLEMKGGDAAAQKSIVDDIALAVKTAPLGSGAQTRALIARAVLVKEKRGASIGAALQVLGPSGLRKDKNEAVPTLINTATSIAALPDITISLNCAVAIAYLQRFPSPSNPEAAHGLINSIVPVDLTLLSFTALFKLIEEINGHELVAATCTKALERLAGNLRVWIGSKDGEKSGLDRETKREIVERCLDITKQVVGMKDAGYESMSEEDMGEGC